MKYFKIFITAVVISLSYIYILYQFAGFDTNAAIFIGSGTVVLSYVLPALQKIFKEQRAKEEKYLIFIFSLIMKPLRE